VPADFEKARYIQLFDHLLNLSVSKYCAAVIHGGDLFDRAPTIQETALVVRYLNAVIKPTYVIPGNHEQIKKDTTFLSELSNMVSNPLVTIITDYATYNIANRAIDFIPFNRLKQFEKEGNTELNSELLITHVRGCIPPHVTPEVDLSIFDRWKLVLAGDLHSHSNSQRNIVYSGSPLTTSFYRNKPKKGILKVDLDNLSVEFIDLNLPALIRLTVESKDEITENTTEDFLVYDIVPKTEAIIEAKEDTVFHKEASREDAILAVLETTEAKKQEVIQLYGDITRNRGY
jgi:DNA repair exonuclease SbcCD nuclease subunit